MKRVFTGLFLVHFVWVSLLSQDLSKAIESIQVSDLKRHMEILAGPQMEGRKTGEPGIERAASYLVDQFSKMDLQSPSGTTVPYRQPFTLYRTGWKEFYMVQANDTLRVGKDFAINGQVPEVSGTFPFVFVGYGLDHPRYSDYRNVDVKGKIVCYVIGEPKDKSGKYITTGTGLSSFSRYDGKKDSVAFAKGAVAAIRIDPADETASRMIRSSASFAMGGMLSLAPLKIKGPAANSYIYMGIPGAARLLGIDPEELRNTIQAMEASRKPSPGFTGTLVYQAVRLSEELVADNITAVLEGDELKDEWVIITAHYDHLGIGANGIRYGADDNASGTIGILEAAEAFSEAAKSGIKPRRSILFLPVSGEEMGLLGSRYYVKNPLVPIDKTVAAVNMDMIGRNDKDHEPTKPYVYVYVSGKPGESTHQAVLNALNQLTTSLKPEFQFRESATVSTGGSDHESFESAKVPVVYFFNGLHPDYHRPGDTPDKILYEQMQETIRMVFLTAWNLANQPKPDSHE